jgi:hypothetical protein
MEIIGEKKINEASFIILLEVLSSVRRNSKHNSIS